MNMLEVHSEALDCSSGPYHEFLLSYKASRPIVYGFVEGKDDPSFYRGFIESVLPNGWAVRIIRSGNKKSVLDVLEVMPWDRFSRGRVCFFVDRDLAEYLEPNAVVSDSLYVTDKYSIENDVVTSHVFERVAVEILKIIDLNDAERETIRELFQRNLSCFCEALTPVMAQILIWRRSVQKAHLDKIKIGTIFNFSNGIISIGNSYQSEISRVQHAANCIELSPSPSDELRAAEAEFRAKGGVERFVRGKYLMWFFAEAAKALHAAIPAYCSRHPTPPRLNLTFAAVNAMAICGPRAKIPSSLREFLTRNYVAYIPSSGITV